MLRAKFRCTFVQKNADGSELVQLNAVYGDKDSVNAQWSKYTPNGSLNMSISLEGAQGKLVPNGEYFLDISPVETA